MQRGPREATYGQVLTSGAREDGMAFGSQSGDDLRTKQAHGSVGTTVIFAILLPVAG